MSETVKGEKKWYELLLWKEMPQVWSRLSPELKAEVIALGIEVPENNE